MKKFIILGGLMLTSCATLRGSGTPTSTVLVCSPAVEGAFSYKDNKLDVCGADKSGAYGWQNIALTKAPPMQPPPPQQPQQPTATSKNNPPKK